MIDPVTFVRSLTHRLKTFREIAGVAVLNLTLSLSVGEATAQGLRYDAKLEGAPSGAIAQLARQSSDLLRSDTQNIGSLTALRRRAERDVARLESVLRSEGYYAGEARFELDRSEETPVIRFKMSPGERFEVTEYLIEYAQDRGNGRPARPADAKVKTNGSPRGADLAGLESGLLAHLHANGYPGARAISRRADADFVAHTARVVFTIDSGPHARFGEIEWIGLERVDPEYAARLKTWGPDEAFSLAALDSFRDNLGGSELFSSIDVAPGRPAADGVTPVVVTAEERKRRTIGTGVSYSTNIGVGGQIFWEHRNLGGSAERLRIEAEGAQIEQSLSAVFSKPFPTRRARFISGAEAKREDTDAFESLSFLVNAGFEKAYRTHWMGRATVQFELSDTEDALSDERSYLIALPLQAIWETAQDPLNPVGTRLLSEITPLAGLSGGDSIFFSLFDFRAALRHPLDDQRHKILGLWSRVGFTAGPETADIPANRRFFSGGGGSVRGYGFQLIGPLSADGDPLGGRSVFEGGAELRWRFTDTIGAVFFGEGGSAFEESYPSFTERLLFGAGAGIRYYTPIGPLRVDAAFPLDRRAGIDDAFQLYISLGQAF